ncbi:MAG TPA: alcohol dehydrogenase catalytic domain-containing protein [Planctomycetota bacterium]|nr:alcohol dehydrogenase catalytic domain-containing protein [Planctomycetota bacterium]
MKALVVEPAGTLQLKEVPLPPLAKGECRIAVKQVGICRTDLELVKGYMNFTGIPGHEFTGRVVEGPDRLINRRVVGEINAACGKCPTCRGGLGRHCPERTVLGIYKRPGAFAQFVDLPEENVLSVPDSVSDEEAVFVEPLAAALEIFEQMHVLPGTRLLVIGDGKLGLLISQVCAALGARVTLFGRHEKKLALARRWNVEAVKPGESAPAFFERYPVVVECTGTPQALALAVNWIAPRGTLVLKSTYAPSQPPQLDWARVVVDEITVLGSRCGPFAPALRLLASGKLDVRALIDHRKTLEQGVEAFELAATRGTLKVLVAVQ